MFSVKVLDKLGEKKDMSKEKEELLLRAMDTSITAIQPEDLDRIIKLVTPVDVKAFTRLGRTKATGLTHEWVEASLNGSLSSGVYADGSIVSDVTNSYTRKNNKVMSLGRIAKATGLMQAIDTLHNANGNQFRDAFALEIEMQMKNFLRSLEYYIFNGDNSVTSPQQMDGLLNTITTNTLNVSGAALTEDNLRSILTDIYAQGGSPSAIYCRPAVAVKISKFNDNKVQWNVNVSQEARMTAGQQVFKYLSPFGDVLDVIPVRTDFLPSGKVIVLDESTVKLAFASNGIEMMDIPTASDAWTKLIKAYVTIEHKAEQYSGVISGVLDSYT